MLQQSALTQRLIMMFSKDSCAMTDHERKKKAEDSQVILIESQERNGQT